MFYHAFIFSGHALADENSFIVKDRSYAEASKSERQLRKEDLIARGLREIDQGRWDKGRDLIAQANDPVGSRLYYWLEFMRRPEKHSYNRMAQFIHANPEWPFLGRLRRHIEEHMPENATPQNVLAWFDDYPPLTAEGLDRFLEALLNTGRQEVAKKVLQEWWSDTGLSRDMQRRIYRKYSRLITKRAHKQRLDMLLFAGSYENAMAIANVLGPDYEALTRARIALARKSGGVNALIDQIPAHLRDDPGLIYERVRWRRKHDYDDGAIALLMKPLPEDSVAVHKKWWQERHILARRLMEKGDFETAYKLVSNHIQKEGFAFAQAEWLAGWLALRFLNRPVDALHHFERLHAKVSTPVSLSRATYWMARAAKEMGSEELSRQWYEKAARYQTTFYGQLASYDMDRKHDLENAGAPKLSSEERKAFEQNTLIRAAMILYKAGMRENAELFFNTFIRQNKTAKAYVFAARAAHDIGLYHTAVSIAKKASQDGLFLTAQSYPILRDDLKKVRGIDWSLVHAIIRQESLFNEQAKSHAGALGLMQVMPATAKETARKAGLQYQYSWLTSRPDYNIYLGSYYITEMIKRYGGNIVLAVAAYNAGPGRVDRWIEIYGDPRTGERDLIDWIELMPIYETRNYVQRVLENKNIYTLRLK